LAKLLAKQRTGIMITQMANPVSALRRVGSMTSMASQRKLSRNASRKFGTQTTVDETNTTTSNSNFGGDKHSLNGAPKGRKKQKGYRQTRILFKFEDSSELEDWIQHLLVELKNQALFVDHSAQVLSKMADSSQDRVEMLLRQSVDLWTLAVGKMSMETAMAQDRLAEWLENDLLNVNSEEAAFWRESAQGIREDVQLRNAVMKNMALLNLSEDDTKNNKKPEKKKTPLEEIQEEVLLFGLSKAEHRVELSEVEKWKLLHAKVQEAKYKDSKYEIGDDLL